MPEEKTNKYSTIQLLLDNALVDAFWIFVVLYRVLVTQTIWNWLVPKHLGWDTVTFGGVFVVQVLLKYIIIGNIATDIKTIKKLQYVILKLKPNSKTAEDWISLVEATLVLGLSWFLITIGML